jgi:hypothetical protein
MVLAADPRRRRRAARTAPSPPACALGLLIVASAAAGGEPPASPDPTSLAARVDLTRISILEAEYGRAAREHDEADLRSLETEVVAMLRDEVLPYASEAGHGAVGGPMRLAEEFISLEGRMDRVSVLRKLSILTSLQALSKRAHTPGRLTERRGAEEAGSAPPTGPGRGPSNWRSGAGRP